MNPKYFTYLELVRTDTGLPNSPTDWQQVVNLQRLAFFLDRLRDYMGSAVIVTSGFRSPEVNARVGGSKTSAHLQGLAADIVPKSRTQGSGTQGTLREGSGTPPGSRLTGARHYPILVVSFSPYHTQKKSTPNTAWIFLVSLVK